MFVFDLTRLCAIKSIESIDYLRCFSERPSPTLPEAPLDVIKVFEQKKKGIRLAQGRYFKQHN